MKERSEILREILALAKNELNEHEGIGYTMPDGKYHIYISVESYVDTINDNESKKVFYYFIEPNRLYDGCAEPIGENTTAEYNNFADLLVGCSWCMEEFERDIERENKIECRVTLDEMKQGWKPKLDTMSITVYKDALGYQDEKDNLTEIEVPKNWLKDMLKRNGVDDFGLWRNVYTADDTDGIARTALAEGVILSCADKNIVFEQEGVLSESLFEQAAVLVDDILKRPYGNDLFYISNIIYSLSAKDLGLSKDEVLKLAKRLNDASTLSTVPLLTAERIDAVKTMLEDGITVKRSAVLPCLTAEQAKKVLLNCELEDFCTIVDQLAVDNQRFYAPDKNDITGLDIDRVEKAIAGILSEPIALEEAIAVARDVSKVKKTNSAEKQIENER